jgi:hypothetical protein
MLLDRALNRLGGCGQHARCLFQSSGPFLSAIRVPWALLAAASQVTNGPDGM